jgi:hypothetical protein
VSAAADGAAEPGGRDARGGRWLLRHPRTTSLALALVLALAADLVAGSLLIEANPGTFRAPHPYHHHGFLANASANTRWGEREYAVHTNSLGFRDRSPRRVALEPAGRRILVIGDSFVEGIGVPFEETVCARLQERLGPTVEVLNGGAVSYSPKLYRLRVEYLLEEVGLRFGELLVLVDISDVQDEVHYESFHPRLPGALDRAWAALRAFLARRSLAFSAVGAILRQRRGGVSNAIDVEDLADNSIYFRDLAAYQVEGGQAAAERGRWEWTIAEPLMEAWGRRGLELARESMRALVELCRARGIAVTVCVYPSPVQILMEDEDSLQVRFWREFAAEAGVGFVDLFPRFVGKEAGRPRAVYKRYFIEGDVHWNAAGHELVAEALLERL